MHFRITKTYLENDSKVRKPASLDLVQKNGGGGAVSRLNLLASSEGRELRDH